MGRVKPAAAKVTGYYAKSVYRKKAPSAPADRPEQLCIVVDLLPSEVVIAEKVDCIRRLAVPGIVVISGLAAQAQGVTKIVLESVPDQMKRIWAEVS